MNELKEHVNKVNQYKLKALAIFEIIDSDDSEESEIDDSKHSQSESNIRSKTGTYCIEIKFLFERYVKSSILTFYRIKQTSI